MLTYPKNDLMKRIAVICESGAWIAKEPERTTLLFGFRLRSRNGPVPTQGLRCLDADTLLPCAAVPEYASNREGEALVFWRHRFGAPPRRTVLEVRLRENSKWTRLAEIRLHPVLQSTLSVADGLTLDISSDPVWAKTDEPVIAEALPKRDRLSRRFSVALSGSPNQLRTLLPYFRHRGCIRLRTLFLEGGEARELETGPGVTVLPFANLAPEALKDVDALMDFTDHETVAALREKRLRGKADPLPLVFCAGKRFFNREGGVSHTFLDWLESLGETEAADALE